MLIFINLITLFVQVFLTLCTLVTLYFAEEVPFTANGANRLSDSAPLLDDLQQNGLEMSKFNPDRPADTANGKTDIDIKHANSKDEDDQNHGFNDGPGAVLVNLLTSLRHLPPGMHSVLIVMALSWVGATIVIHYFSFLQF